MGHAILSPSGSKRWIECPGSVAMAIAYPVEDTSSPYADEGTDAHTLGERCLNTGKPPETWLGEILPKGNEVVEEMVQAISYYISYIHEFTTADSAAWWAVEYSAPLWYSPGDSGTVDLLAVEENVLHIMDLKYGKGVRVEVADNTQLLIYAISALRSIQEDPFNELEIHEVWIHIIQPRISSEGGTFARYDIAAIEGWAEEIEKKAAAAMSATEDDCNPGEAQCRWCAQSGRCTAQIEYASETLGADFSDLDEEESPQEIAGLTNDQIGRLLLRRKTVENWFTALATTAAAELMAGNPVAGHKMVLSNPNRVWGDEGDAQKALTNKYGQKATEKRTFLSPAQAEALMKTRKASARLVNRVTKCIMKPKGSPTLAQETDNRPALSYGTAAGFADLDTEASDDLLG